MPATLPPQQSTKSLYTYEIRDYRCSSSTLIKSNRTSASMNTTSIQNIERIKDIVFILKKNISILNNLLHLQDNWNSNGAKPFRVQLINTAIDILISLPIQPEVFPTGRNSIQFEYHKNNNYLEFEVYEDRIEYLMDVDGTEKEDVITKDRISELIMLFNA